MQKIKKLLPLIILVIGFIILQQSSLGSYLSFDALKENRADLLAFRDANYIVSFLIFIGIYIVTVAFSLPFAAFLTISGGFLFGNIFGTFFVVLGATLGAICIFLAAKTALGEGLKAKAGPWLKKLEAGFKENAVSYMLFLRLVPAFPFFVVNVVPALLGARLLPFALTTFVGIIPGAFVYATVGTGLGSIFDRGDEFSFAGILTPEILIALIGLGVLAIVPIFVKKIKARKATQS